MIKKYAIYAGISALLMLAACSPHPETPARPGVAEGDTTGKLPVRYVYDEFAHKLVHVQVCNQI
ncbi:hypothetical protein [Dyadobacter sandarakinus]|uniref:Uncharacterized protein n=1 Tax=Dyadobacter sandarakinus TaxID=2747268 RepID=A0ABX7I4G3_9BACT|nr:hypothetical protein [Dyadobacter sandarakinus]QRR00994.1 hypothetical protein HWI92_08815 [Dyadobacter sandarakinus]